MHTAKGLGSGRARAAASSGLATGAESLPKTKKRTQRAIKLYRCTDAYVHADNAPPLGRRAPGTMVCHQALREWEVEGQAAPGLPRFLFRILKS